ncbi:unnamed protein product [Prorocentrum cordatum]|uniref:Peptidase M11 gametolysin domain-containing protein n=1 Tax=Prorocentrum cordatum TaxID=2364126 RepID=A0ABN9XHG6_9DINO|nr:unnamed protein product [Polarella glacialis]
MTLSLLHIVAATCACNVREVASVHVIPSGGDELRPSLHFRPELSPARTHEHSSPITPEELFNEYLDTHPDDAEYAPSGATGSMVSPSGSYGPILVVYMTYNGATPGYPDPLSLAGVQDLFWQVPGFNDSLYHSSWHKLWLDADSVDFFHMEAPVDPANWGSSLWNVYRSVSQHGAFMTQYQTRSYTNVMVLYPGSTFRASAYLPSSGSWNGWSQYQGQAITWQTFFHEVGHNWGLVHCGGYNADGTFSEYLDDAIMGYLEGTEVFGPQCCHALQARLADRGRGGGVCARV